MNYVPESLSTPEEAFHELVKLSERNNSRFKIVGDKDRFVIKAKSDNVLIASMLVIILTFPIAFLLQEFHDPIRWAILLGTLVLIMLFLRYYPSSNDIEIDGIKHSIYIRSNNFIGEYIVPSVLLPFGDFEQLSFKERGLQSEGTSQKWNRISIEFKNEKKHLIDLPNGPYYYVNHHVFMKALDLLLKG